MTALLMHSDPLMFLPLRPEDRLGRLKWFFIARGVRPTAPWRGYR